MGLDMYLYRFRKANVVENNIYTDDPDLDNVRFVEYDDYLKLPKSMQKICTPVFKKVEFYNRQKILQENGCSKSAKMYISAERFTEKGMEVTFCIYDGDAEKNVTIPVEKLKDYLVPQVVRRYAYTTEEINYQRKGLDNDGWDFLPENCEYCDDKSVIEALCNHGLSTSFLDDWEDDSTVFLAWW
jgi:hypothetical protein